MSKQEDEVLSKLEKLLAEQKLAAFDESEVLIIRKVIAAHQAVMSLGILGRWLIKIGTGIIILLGLYHTAKGGLAAMLKGLLGLGT